MKLETNHQRLILCKFTGDGAFSFQEFVEIVYNMGGTAEKTADQEEKELRDAFRVNKICFH